MKNPVVSAGPPDLPLSTRPEEAVVAELLHTEAALDEAHKSLFRAIDTLSGILNEAVLAALRAAPEPPREDEVAREYAGDYEDGR